MKVLIVYAHPEPRSLNGSMKDFSVRVLQELGHEVQVSDLYAMKWKSQVDADDFQIDYGDEPFNAVTHSKKAFKEKKLTDDVAAEQRKLLWADAVILQFPFWWFSLPAILKGWIDRVYAYGFGYGLGEHSEKKWGDRYGEGTLQGKRAVLFVTCGGWPTHYEERGINGPIEDLLFHINHGMLFYPGFDVLRSLVLYRTMLPFDAARWQAVEAQVREKLQNLFTEKPIPYRKQNGGDYRLPLLTIKDEVPVKGHGFQVHERHEDV